MIQFLAQCYLVYRYWTIAREDRKHVILCALFAALIVLETALWLASFPLLVFLHQAHPNRSITALYIVDAQVFRYLNTVANGLAAAINCGLGVIFARRMVQVKGDDEHLNPLLRKAIHASGYIEELCFCCLC